MDGGASRIDQQLITFADGLQACPYLPSQVARMPLMVSRHAISPSDLDQLLSCGYRRSGNYFYRTRCPACQECVPVRVRAGDFPVRPSFRRILNRADRELEILYGEPMAGPERLELFNHHRHERSLGEHSATVEDLESFLVESCVESIEVQFRFEGSLAAVAIADLGQSSVNAVYTYFHTDFKRFSPGTLAVLEFIRLAKQTKRTFVYLGLFVAECRHLNYKSRFWPQERRLGEQWLRFDTAD
ncbi:MAG: arginyltransferase [Planctomycetota bacterium]